MSRPRLLSCARGNRAIPGRVRCEQAHDRKLIGSAYFTDSRPDCRRPAPHHCSRGRSRAIRPLQRDSADSDRTGGQLPPELNTLTSAQIETAWPDWIERHDREIRARLERGDEDTIVNWMLFGTSFTSRPRAVLGAVESGTAGDRELVLRRTIELISARLDDLLPALAAPGTDERRLFARAFLERKGLRFSTAADREAARDYLRAAVVRVATEQDQIDQELGATAGGDPSASSFSGRGCSARAACHSTRRWFQLFGRAGTGGDEGAWAAQARRRQTRGDRRSRTRLRRQGRRLRLLSSTDAAAFCGA